MLARGLELVAYQAQVQQKDSEIILGAGGIELALAAGCAPAVQRLGGNGKHELDSGFDLAGVQSGLEPAELHSPAIPDVVEVHAVVAVMWRAT